MKLFPISKVKILNALLAENLPQREKEIPGFFLPLNDRDHETEEKPKEK